ncbi:MAG TPA: TonB-dependent receptor [Kofleriaceae bacterium]|nr:TonB-dependent receptor [Kofleriaceae bacterium]
MLRVLVAFAVVAAALPAAASPRVVRGVITAQDTARPIAGATVTAAHGQAAVSDVDGYFAIALDDGDRQLVIAAAGYATRTVIADDVVRVALAPAAEVIEISGRAPEQTRPLAYELTAAEVRLMPGAGNDVLRAAQALPGVARIPYAFGGLVLRGTSPSDTEVYLDGIEVPIAFHFGGLTSFYPSGMLADLAVTPGGFDASYGRAQGGLVTLTTREPRTDRWRVSGSLGLLDSAVTAEGPLLGGGVILGVRRSYFASVAKPFVGSDVPLPSYWDAQLRGSFGDPAGLGRVTPIVFLSIDDVANATSGAVGQPEKVSIDSMFVRGAVPYLKQWGPLSLHVVPWFGTNRLSFEDVNEGERETFERPVYPGGLRADLTRDVAWGHLRGGLDASGGYLSHTQVGFTGTGEGPMQQDGTSTISWLDTALWGEARVKLDGDRFAVRPGVRLEHYGLTGEWVLDPRVNLSEKLADPVTLRAAVGRYHQPPTPADVDPQNGNPRLRSSFFDQFSLGVDADVSVHTTASITGFYDYGQHLAVPVPSGPGNTFEPDLGGLGPTFQLLLEKQLGFSVFQDDVGRARSEGIEVQVKHSVGRWFGILAYTLSRAQRTDAPSAKDYVGIWRPFELDQRHNLNLAGSVALAHWRLGARLQIVSGDPYSPTVCVNGCRQLPWAGTLPTFIQLDLRADRRWERPWGAINVYIDVQNATDYGNVEGREYDSDLRADRDIPGLPIIPFIGVEFVPS